MRSFAAVAKLKPFPRPCGPNWPRSFTQSRIVNNQQQTPAVQQQQSDDVNITEAVQAQEPAFYQRPLLPGEGKIWTFKHVFVDKPDPLRDFYASVSAGDASKAIDAFLQLPIKQQNRLEPRAIHDYLHLILTLTMHSRVNIGTRQMLSIVDQMAKRIDSSVSLALFPLLMRFYTRIGEYSKTLSVHAKMMANEKAYLNHTAYAALCICYEKTRKTDKAIELYQQTRQLLAPPEDEDAEVSETHVERVQKFKKESTLDHFLLERTMMRVHGQRQQLDDTRSIMKSLEVDGHFKDSITRKLVLLAYLDACASAQDYEQFTITRKQLEDNGMIGPRDASHVLMGLLKFGKHEEMIGAMNSLSGVFIPFDNTLMVTSDDPVKELYNRAKHVSNSSFPPSLFSDLNFQIGKDIAKLRREQKSIDTLVATAQIVYKEYERQIHNSYKNFVAVAEKMHKQSLELCIARPHHRNELVVLDCPTEPLFHIIMRNETPWVAMARLYMISDMRGAAMRLMKDGSKYTKYSQQQLYSVFLNKIDEDELRELMEDSST